MFVALLRNNGTKGVDGGCCEFLHLISNTFHLIHQIPLALVQRGQSTIYLFENVAI